MFGLGGLIAGILLILIGGGLIFFFPGTSGKYQPSEFSITIIVTGFVMIILGAVIVFV